MLNKTVGGWQRARPAAFAVTVPVTLEIGLGVRASLMRLC
jgi:hypothetical protein